MSPTLPQPCRDWLVRVNAVMKRDWCIDAEDAGWSDEDILRYWRFAQPPEAFVEWYAEKYGLIDFS
ncbi:hypothetical protein [Brevundimonas sp.]|uniref:hypothetical protein n=1 Tax=Brevundimonas sp. TaxID=1871086 RepID=UPI002EDA6E46